jgi:hypothetical protein
LRGKKGAVVAECRTDAGPCHGTTDGAAHKVVTTGEFQAVFCKLAGEVADAYTGLGSHSVTIGIYVLDLIQAG